MTVVSHCHPLFVRPVPYYLPGKASFKLCWVDYVMLGLVRLSSVMWAFHPKVRYMPYLYVSTTRIRHSLDYVMLCLVRYGLVRLYKLFIFYPQKLGTCRIYKQALTYRYNCRTYKQCHINMKSYILYIVYSTHVWRFQAVLVFISNIGHT